jgi:DNA-binding CsgD family transcriptional regulator
VPSSWPLTARSDDLDRITRWSRDRQVGGVVLTGPAGVGKTRLGEEVLDRAAGSPTSRAVGHPATQRIPLGALAHLLPPDLARDLGTDEDDRASLFHGARASLAERAGDQRLVLLVDDVDQLDETSLALLLPLTVDRTLFVVATLRAGRALPKVIDALVKDGHLATYPVPPLDGAAIASLLDLVLDGPIEPAAATQLAERSQGNLQVLQELVWRAMAEDLLRVEHGVWRLDSLPRSGSLEELVASHLDGIDLEARETLDLLAVAGTIDLAELDGIADRRVLEELETREVIRVMTDDRRTTVGLTHPVYGEVIRSQMPVLRTRAIQRRLADQLDRRGAQRREDVTRLALWRLEAGGDVDVDVLLRAGRLALVGRDADLAGRLAAAAADRGAAVRAAPIAVEAATLGADPEGVEHAVAKVWNDPALPDQDRVHLARRLSMSRFSGGDLAGALTAVSEAEELLTDSTLRAGVQAQRAHLLASNGRPQEALDVLAAIDTDAADVTDGRLRIELAAARSTACLTVGRFQEARAAAQLGAQAQQDLPEWLARRGMATHLVNEAHALAYGGNYRDARLLIEGALESAKDRGALAAQVWFEVVLGEIERDCGYAQASIDHFESAVTLAALAGQQAALVWAWVGVAQGRLLLGDIAGGSEALDRAEAVGDSPVATSWSTAMRTRAWLLAGRGDLGGARKLLSTVATVVRGDGIWTFEATLHHDLVRFGDPDAAVDRLDALAEIVEGPLVQAFACHARAAAAMDRSAYEETLARFEAMDRVASAAEVALELADVLRRQGDARAAAAAARRSQQLVETSGGVRTPPLLRGITVEPLTRREREVALLAATGLQSKEIAERLTVSKRTVDTHLDRIYRKLGVTSRDQLADALGPRPAT